MFQAIFRTRHSVLNISGSHSSHRRSQLSKRYRPIAFATENLRLALCFPFDCGIRVKLIRANNVLCHDHFVWNGADDRRYNNAIRPRRAGRDGDGSGNHGDFYSSCHGSLCEQRTSLKNDQPCIQPILAKKARVARDVRVNGIVIQPGDAHWNMAV